MPGHVAVDALLNAGTLAVVEKLCINIRPRKGCVIVGVTVYGTVRKPLVYLTRTYPVRIRGGRRRTP